MMNPLYNNRIYYALDPEYIKKVVKHIAHDGNYVGKTLEFVNCRIVIPSLGRHVHEYFEHAGSKIGEVVGLMQAISAGDCSYITDTYDSMHYVFLKDEVKRAGAQFTDDCVLTRRAVISFPATHCFENIQVMARDGDAVITVNMRSCNAYANLASDLYLAYLLAAEAYSGTIWNPKEVTMIANFGSLHVFREDAKNVL